jgi:hypothetical protein
MKFATIWGVILSLSVLPLLVAQQLSDTGVYKTSDGKDCPMVGTGNSAANKALNRLKNRFIFPDDSDIDKNVTLAAMLAPGDDTDRFVTHEAAKVTGVVINVKVGGKENCNCQATNPIDMDAHIELALHKDAPKNQRVIVEITPRFRLLKKGKGTDWSTATLEKTTDDGIKGKWVEVTGWLLFDSIHADDAENTNPGGSMNWRATCWEIHPVTEMKVVPEPPDGTPQLHPTVLESLQKAHAQHAKRDPKRQAAINGTIEGHLKGFDKDDLKEKEEEAKDRLKDK